MTSQTAILIVFLASDVLAAASGKEVWRARLEAAEECKTQGRLPEAERLLWSALDEARALQPNPAPAAAVYHELAGFYQDAGQCDRAARAYQRSVELWAKAGASGEPYLLRTANHLVGLHLECGATGAAERDFRSLVAPRLAAGGRESDADVAQALTNLGSIEYKKGRYSDARSHYEKALALRERLPAEPAEVGVLLHNLAFALLRGGEVEAALASSRRALTLFEANAGAAPALLLSALVSAADLNMMARRWTEAEALLDRALAWAQRTVGDGHRLTATVLSYQAVLCKATHRKKEGAALESRAREIRLSWLRSADRQAVNVRVLSELEKPHSVQ